MGPCHKGVIRVPAKLRTIIVAHNPADEDWARFRAIESSIATVCERLTDSDIFQPVRHVWQVGVTSEIVLLEDEQGDFSVLRDASGNLFTYSPRLESPNLTVQAWRSVKELGVDAYSKDEDKRKSALKDLEQVEAVLRYNLNKRPAP